MVCSVCGELSHEPGLVGGIVTWIQEMALASGGQIHKFMNPGHEVSVFISHLRN